MGKENIKLTTDDFIAKSRKTHGDTYDYSKTVYVNSKTRVIITCKIHGDFLQNPSAHHVRGDTCKKCSAIKMGAKNITPIAEFIRKANIKHNNRYDYSLLKQFKKLHEKVDIICKIHGPFHQALHTHLFGNGCVKCSYIERGLQGSVSFDEYVERAKDKFGDLYTYHKESYTKISAPVEYTCNIHGRVSQMADTHLKTAGCNKCFPKQEKDTTESFIKKAILRHGVTYSYTKVVYMDSYTKVTIGCLIHGDFEQIPNTHLHGGGCLECARVMTNGYSRSQFKASCKNRPAILYLLKITMAEECFYKIGITSRSVEKRFRNSDLKRHNYTYEVLFTSPCFEPEKCWDKEKEVLNKFHEYKIIPKREFSGKTECLSIDTPLDKIIETIKIL